MRGKAPLTTIRTGGQRSIRGDMRLRLHIQAFLAAAIMCIVERPTQVQETHVALSGADKVVRLAVYPDTPLSRSTLDARDGGAGRARAAKGHSAPATGDSIWQRAIERLKALFGR
jgi:hypothetical protein